MEETVPGEHPEAWHLEEVALEVVHLEVVLQKGEEEVQLEGL
jgi:hypothetical protein